MGLPMERPVSLIIPNYNGGAVIRQCLEAAFASQYKNFEVIVADDGSTDGSLAVIERFPCRLVRLERRSGAGAARNRGAEAATGDILFFTDADCFLRPDALARAVTMMQSHPGAIVGGTYTPLPADRDFFSTFQSLFVHYSETRRTEPDYIAGHALIIEAGLFRESKGFPETTVPIPEDVLFSHRLRHEGRRLLMDPDLQVVHAFRFSLRRSLANAYRKAKYWTLYSLAHHDLLADSGTASQELKVNVASFGMSAVCAGIAAGTQDMRWLIPDVFFWTGNLAFSRGLLGVFRREKGMGFAVLGALYYTLVFPIAVALGACAGVGMILRSKSELRGLR